jgi:hypothetical protein
MHFLGTAQLDWSCYLTSIQRQVRKHINENFTISFDCASPFIATAHGLVYTNAQHTSKRWSVIMDKAPDNKAISQNFDIPFPFESEIGRRLTQGDLCWYKPGMLNKINKEGKTSWDSFSYAIQMGHNVWSHLTAVQEANRQYDLGLTPRMLVQETFDRVYFRDVVEAIFATSDKGQALAIIEDFSKFWMSIIGTRGATGKKTVNASTMFNNLFESEELEEHHIDDSGLDETNLDNLEGQLGE